MSQGSPEKQTIGDALPSARWRLRKAGGVIEPESERMRTRRTNGIKLSPTAGEGERSTEAEKKGQILPFSAFSSILAFSGLDHAYLHREGKSTLLRHHFKCSSHRNTQKYLTWVL